MKPARIASLLALIALAGGGVAWALWPEDPPPPEPPEARDHDSGMTDEQTIRLMEEIGYIQQEE